MSSIHPSDKSRQALMASARPNRLQGQPDRAESLPSPSAPRVVVSTAGPSGSPRTRHIPRRQEWELEKWPNNAGRSLFLKGPSSTPLSPHPVHRCPPRLVRARRHLRRDPVTAGPVCVVVSGQATPS
ncbi:hypothetical protein NDU88_005035 [Pleurodeles waltl]|uniref:Uncharacterized protein n=1 Tax=Pleurodeles waltl TaxID=8319 RepID=A0AAV7W705_PLEWA|nr:hypothetical protein NDU88_005035 [Pleurodeles waltl]